MRFSLSFHAGFAVLAMVAGATSGWCAVGAEDLDAAIERHRKGVLVIEARPGTEVEVTQERHEFWFGAALANQAFGGRMRPEDREAYLEVFRTNFNAAVTENALKWHDMERRKGEVDYDVVDRMLAWTEENGIPLRGHNIFWGIPNRVQPWLKEMPDEELLAAVRQRALDIGSRYKGRFAEYDLNNEMIHGNYYEERLGKGITLKMAQWVREADPGAVLYLNDYDVLTGARLANYARQIEGLLEQGMPIGGIGAQGHLHGERFDREALRKALEELSKFNLPIRITEFNMPGQRSRAHDDRSVRLTAAAEEEKARELADYYRICFASPRVEGILMWGFWEGANWIPASSLYGRDWRPLPAARTYQELVYGEWWTRWRGQADGSGRCEVPAFFGSYLVKAGGQERRVSLRRADKRLKVSFQPDFEGCAEVLRRGIERRDFPGCSVVAGTDEEGVWSAGFGAQDYSGGAAVDRNTIYDLASVTKVAGTTAVFMRLAALGKVRLDDAVGKFLPEFLSAAASPEERTRRERVTVEHLLTHSAGLTAWKPFYKSVEGYSNVLLAACEPALEYEPGERSRYSDCSMMLAGGVAARAGGKPLGELERELVFEPLGMASTMRCPPAEVWRRIPPTELDPATGKPVHGVVHDENARAGEGWTGHAGLFATAEDLGKLARELLRGMQGKSELFPRAVLEEFFRPRQIGTLTRAVGWNFSDSEHGRVVNHTGFTGTYVQINLDEGWYVVLLTNRVHPTRDNSGIGRTRRAFLDCMQEQLGGGPRLKATGS